MGLCHAVTMLSFHDSLFWVENLCQALHLEWVRYRGLWVYDAFFMPLISSPFLLIYLIGTCLGAYVWHLHLPKQWKDAYLCISRFWQWGIPLQLWSVSLRLPGILTWKLLTISALSVGQLGGGIHIWEVPEENIIPYNKVQLLLFVPLGSWCKTETKDW